MKVCPGCDHIDKSDHHALAEREKEDVWWCQACLTAPITAELDRLSLIRPQRPAGGAAPT